LGIIPDVTYAALKELAIPGMKVMRWQRKPDGHFIPVEEYDTCSVTTVSTPDMTTLGGWWQEERSAAQIYAAEKGWCYEPALTYNQRLSILKDAHHSPSTWHINLLQEYLALFPELSWPSHEQERINIPGTLQKTNWNYHYRPNLAEITSHIGLKEALKKIIPQDKLA
ncbi:MAG: 4-alpha-glucanotransferase, partial [Chlamydiota bacterium]